MSEPESNNNEQTRPATATERAGAGAGTGTGTGTGAGKGNWNFFGTGPKTEDKSKEPEKDYIDKFERQTTFIFYEQEEKRGPTFGLQEQPASLKVILRGLYNEYYKKMMDGVLEFTNENELNEDVKNMFKRALQALAEKKRIDNAAPPYEFEDSKSVISQMVLYDDEGKDKRLPILIYDPCIFELENGVKPSVENFHTIQKIFKDYELVGWVHEEWGMDVPNFYKTKFPGGGKYVGGGIASVAQVLERLNYGLTPSREYHYDDKFTPYNGRIYNRRKWSMTVRNTIRAYLTGSSLPQPLPPPLPPSSSSTTVATSVPPPPPPPLQSQQDDKGSIKGLNEYLQKMRDFLAVKDVIENRKYHMIFKDILKIIILHFFDPSIEENDPRTTEQKGEEETLSKNGYIKNLKDGIGVAEAEKTVLEASYDIVDDEEKIEAEKMWRAIEIATYLSVNLEEKLRENDKSKQTFTKFLNDKFLQQDDEELKKLGRNIIQLLKTVNIKYEGVRGENTTIINSMKKGFVNRLFGSKKEAVETEAKKQTAEEAPDNILLKNILNYGVWKKKNNMDMNDIFMIEPEMMKYLLTGKKDDSYKPEAKSTSFLPINYTQTKKPIPMEPVSKEAANFYGKNFSFHEYKYKVEGEVKKKLFQQSEWYSEFNKMQSTKKGGQSKNTTAKKNKSKRNKSKKNK